MSLVDLTLRDDIAQLVLNRAAEENRITTAMMKQLAEAITEAEKNRAVVLVISGRGGDFSVGRDQHEQLRGADKIASLSLAVSVNEALELFQGVTVASVQGRALGFACGVVLQCDLSVAADTAVMGFDEMKHGFTPTIVLSYVEKYVHRRHVADLILTGRSVPAYEARAMCLVNWVVPEDDLAGRTDAICTRLAGRGRELIGQYKEYLRDISEIDERERSRFALERAALYANRMTSD